MSKDIVERIRSLRYVHVPVASQLFEEAATEIERLRLTDEERQAIGDAIVLVDYGGVPVDHTKATLRKLLKRLS